MMSQRFPQAGYPRVAKSVFLLEKTLYIEFIPPFGMCLAYIYRYSLSIDVLTNPAPSAWQATKKTCMKGKNGTG